MDKFIHSPFVNFAFYMIHRGQIAEEYARRGKFTMVELAYKMGYKSRKTLYNKFAKKDLEYEDILRLENILEVDMSEKIPELKKLRNQLSEPGSLYVRVEKAEHELHLTKSLLLQALNDIKEMKQAYDFRVGIVTRKPKKVSR